MQSKQGVTQKEINDQFKGQIDTLKLERKNLQTEIDKLKATNDQLVGILFTFFFQLLSQDINNKSSQKNEREQFTTQNTFPVRKTKELSFEAFKARNESAIEETLR